jgi:hypothetical protein
VAVPAVRRQQGEGGGEEPLAAAPPEEIARPLQAQAVLGQGGVDPVLEPGALPGEDHAGAGEIPLIAEGTGRDPHRGERAAPLEPVQSPGVELIGLIHHAEHELRLPGVDELRDLAGRFDLVHNPVPGADGLDRHRRAALAGGQELLQGAPNVVDPALVPAFAVLGLHGHLRVALVGIEGNVLHGSAPPLSAGTPPAPPPGSTAAYAAVLRRGSAFIASDSPQPFHKGVDKCPPRSDSISYIEAKRDRSAGQEIF